MILTNSNYSNFKSYKNIICIGNKTKLGSLMVESLRKLEYKNHLNLNIIDFYDSRTFFSKNLEIKEKISKENIIVFLFTTGGVRTQNHNNERVTKSLEDDLILLNYLNKYCKKVHIVYISSVLGLINTKKNKDYSWSKRKAEIELKQLFNNCENIKKLSIVYPGRLIKNWKTYISRVIIRIIVFQIF